MSVRLSASRSGHNNTRRKVPGTHFCYTLTQSQDHRKDLDKSEMSSTSPGFEPTAFRVVAKRLRQLRYRGMLCSYVTTLCQIFVLDCVELDFGHSNITGKRYQIF
jgi:hypothetical protein